MNAYRTDYPRATDHDQWHYLKYIEHIEPLTDHSTRYYMREDMAEFSTGKLIVDIGVCEHDLSRRNDMMRIWKRAKLIDRMHDTHITVDTYCVHPDGSCWGEYNITHTDAHRINFDYILPFSEENIALLLTECIKLWQHER